MFNSDISYMFFCGWITRLTSLEISQLKIISFQNCKQWYLIHICSDNAFKSTVVNRAMSSLRQSTQSRIIYSPVCWILFQKYSSRFWNKSLTSGVYVDLERWVLKSLKIWVFDALPCKIKFYNPYIFATCWWTHLIFQTYII